MLAFLLARPTLIGLGIAAAIAGVQTVRLHALQAEQATDRAQHAEAIRMAERRATQAQQDYMAERLEREQATTVIVQEVERVVTRPVYRDRDCLDADGVRLVNAASAAASAARGADAPVPAASATR